MMMFEAMGYRPAMPQESPDTVAARKKAKQAHEVQPGARDAAPLVRTQKMSKSGSTPVPHSPRRVLLAMSDGNPVSGDSPHQPVQGYNVPGRKPTSQMPWEFFLGNAAHRLIAYMYGVNHPRNQVFYNSKSIDFILRRSRIGDLSRLLPNERELRPDITDVSMWSVFEIKPWNEASRQEGRQEVLLYLAALNRATASEVIFVGGRHFQGEVLIRFAQGQYVWRLEWKTTEPGVVQYRWTRSQQRFASQAAAYQAAQWVDLTEQEMQQYGGWVAQAVEGMVSRREQLAMFSGAIGIAIDIVGGVAVGIFTGTLLGRRGSPSGTQRPPGPPIHGSGQVIPFPAKPPPSMQPAQVPAASGM
jgi:hypothetical protein